MARVWMPMYWGDYQKKTSHLSTIEHGAYMLLIGHYWINGSLPESDDRLARICRLTLKDWLKIKDIISDFFYDGWKHKRIEEEMEISLQNSNNAREKARKRWGNNDAAAMPQHCRSNAVASPQHMPSICPSPSPSPSPSVGGDVATPTPRKSARRLPPDWTLPDDYRKAALEKGLSETEISNQAERMLNWSLSSKNGAKLDWYRTWLNWIADAPRLGSTGKPAQRDLRNVPDNLLSNEQYWAKRRQLREA